MLNTILEFLRVHAGSLIGLILITTLFYVAVTEFDLSWDEVKLLNRNSLKYAVVAPGVKQNLLEKFADRMKKFERDIARSGIANLGPMPETRSFICERYDLCN